MQYPVWELGFAGGGLLIAVIAVIHVYVAHFAVGGGLFLYMAERRAYAENSRALLAYVKRHTRFFLLLTMVFGGLTGVGIWFIVSLVSPAAISVLIKNFVFGWATEWVFFVGEITALLIYYYYFDRMKREDHLRIGFLYFLFAWLSLFVITGVIGFMLTPGNWLKSGDFWDGFLNPSFWPAVLFRTLLSFVFAGIFAYLTAVFSKDTEVETAISRYATKWLIIALVLLVPSAWWHLNALPEIPREMVLKNSPEVMSYVRDFLYLTPILAALGLFMALKLPLPMKRLTASLLLLTGLLYMGAFEFIRESARRPYLIYDYMWSTQIPVSMHDEINEKGLLAASRWTRNKSVNDGNMLDAGRELFNIQCLPCHSVKGPLNEIGRLSRGLTKQGIEAGFEGHGSISPYMPPVLGTAAEKKALAAYVARIAGLTDGEEAKGGAEFKPYAPLSFNPDKDGFILLAWTDLGLNALSDTFSRFFFQNPGSNIYAQLIKRGEQPVIVTEDVEISYEPDGVFESPDKNSDFRNYAQPLTGRQIAPGTGNGGKGLKGTLDPDEDGRLFRAENIPVVPFTDGGKVYNPYPMFTLTAKTARTGQVLAVAKIAVPVAAQWNCGRCHAGKPASADASDSLKSIADGILQAHDRRNRTDLHAKARAGQPVSCKGCHAESSKKGRAASDRMGFSATIHGFHAPYARGKGAEACLSCHPGSASNTVQSMRDFHGSLAGLDCTSCHGVMEDHSLSLLRYEASQGREKTASKLMQRIKPVEVDAADKINPRRAWDSQPDCLSCHVDFKAPSAFSAFNLWTKDKKDLYRMRTDDVGIRCQGCHGPTHALYPSSDGLAKDRDNALPMLYQKNRLPIGTNKNCRLCHMGDKQDEIHHPNTLRDFRNPVD